MTSVQPSTELGTVGQPSVGNTRSSKGVLLQEVFGPTFQGEGPGIGRLAAFVRFGGCNQHCVWCDEPKSWVFDQRHAAMHWAGVSYDPTKVLSRRTVEDVGDDVLARLPGRGTTVFTGGEPMLQQDGLLSIIRYMLNQSEVVEARLQGNGSYPDPFRFEVETAGTISPVQSPLWSTVQFNVSPKLAHSGNEEDLRYKPEVLKRLRDFGAIFKFVVSHPDHLDEVDRMVSACEIPPDRVWIMPEGESKRIQLHRMPLLADLVLAHGWNFTPRLHILIWDREKQR